VEGSINPALGRDGLTRLQPADVQSDINDLAQRGLPPYTIPNHRAVLRRALNDATRWGLCTRNVAQLVSLPRMPTEEGEPMTVMDAQRFLKEVEGTRLAVIYQVALSLGMRQREILGLSWGAVNLDAQTLTVCRDLQRYGGAWHHDDPKTPKSRRVLSIPDELTAALRVQRTQQIEDRLRAGPVWIGNDSDLVFSREDGRPISNSTLTKSFQATLERCGLPRQRFHDLRHSAASFMLAQGVPLRIISEVLGHADTAITSRVYAHVAPELAKEATASVEALLRASHWSHCCQSPRAMDAAPTRSLSSLTSRSGGIGRRDGLKNRWGATPVPVRVRPSVPDHKNPAKTGFNTGEAATVGPIRAVA